MPTTSNFGWTTPADTDLVKDGALAIRTLGNGIDTSLVDLKGGTTGQILSKASNTDLDYTWINNDQGDITGITTGATSGLTGGVTSGTADLKLNTTAKGGLLVGTGSGTASELAVGTNSQVLTADSTTATGLKWATAAGGGKVLQVVGATTTTSTTIATTTYTDTTITATITPTATTSKILVLINGYAYMTRASSGQAVGVKLLRGATAILTNDFAFYPTLTGVTSMDFSKFYPITYLDSPATTSSTTYKLQGRIFQTTNSGSSIWQESSNTSTITLLEIGA